MATSKLTPSKANQTQTKKPQILPTYPTPNSTPTQPQPTKSNLQIFRQRGSVFSEFDHTLAQGLDIPLGNYVFSVGSKIPKTTGANKKNGTKRQSKFTKTNLGTTNWYPVFCCWKRLRKAFCGRTMRFVALTSLRSDVLVEGNINSDK